MTRCGLCVGGKLRFGPREITLAQERVIDPQIHIEIGRSKIAIRRDGLVRKLVWIKWVMRVMRVMRIVHVEFLRRYSVDSRLLSEIPAATLFVFQSLKECLEIALAK